jgi:hypothetical protein
MKFSGMWTTGVDEVAEDDNLNRWEYLTQNFDRDDCFSDAKKPLDALPILPPSNDDRTEFSNFDARTFNVLDAMNRNVTTIEADAAVINASSLSAYMSLQQISFPLPTMWSQNSDGTMVPTSATTNLLSTLQPRPMMDHPVMNCSEDRAVTTSVDMDEPTILEPDPMPVDFLEGFQNKLATASDSLQFAAKELEFRRIMQSDPKMSVVSADSDSVETISLLPPLKVTKMCIPLTAYNYFYRNERDNIVRNMKRPGDPLPDPDHDFSQSKQEELLYQRW